MKTKNETLRSLLIKKCTLLSYCVGIGALAFYANGQELGSQLLAESSDGQPLINVNWQFAELANCHDLNAESQSYCDVIEARLFQELPHFQLNRNATNVSRMESMMRGKIDFCTMDLFHSKERERHMVFSKPVHWVFSNVLLARKESGLTTGPVTTAISLSTLNLDGTVVGVRKGRRYSEEINKFLDNEHIRKNIYVAKDDKTLASMLSAGRIDYMFVNPPEISAFDGNDNFVSYPIEASPLSPVYVSCTRTKKGMRTIYAVNQAIENVPRSELITPYLDALPNELHYAFRVKLETKLEQ